MLKNSISNPSLGLSVEIQSWFSSQFVLIEYINKYLTASFYKRIFSTWQTRYTYAWKQYFMRSNNTEVQNIIKKNIRASAEFQCILLWSFCIIFCITCVQKNNILRPHGK